MGKREQRSEVPKIFVCDLPKDLSCDSWNLHLYPWTHLLGLAWNSSGMVSVHGKGFGSPLHMHRSGMDILLPSIDLPQTLLLGDPLKVISFAKLVSCQPVQLCHILWKAFTIHHYKLCVLQKSMPSVITFQKHWKTRCLLFSQSNIFLPENILGFAIYLLPLCSIGIEAVMSSCILSSIYIICPSIVGSDFASMCSHGLSTNDWTCAYLKKMCKTNHSVCPKKTCDQGYDAADFIIIVNPC